MQPGRGGPTSPETALELVVGERSIRFSFNGVCSGIVVFRDHSLVGIELDIHVETMWYPCSGSKGIGNPDHEPALHQALWLKVASIRRSMSEIRAGIKGSEIGLYGLQRQATEADRAFGHCRHRTTFKLMA